MNLDRLSASAVQVAEGCLARFAANRTSRGGEMKNDAALTGSAVHDALETFVQKAIIDKEIAPDFMSMEIIFRKTYSKWFNSSDYKTDPYRTGIKLLAAWLERTSWEDVEEIVSLEVKKSFPLKTSIGKIPFNYIFDRLDRLGPGHYRVVDYKTSTFAMDPGQLFEKIQARVYGVAVAVEHPDAEVIEVVFDMLKHSGPVGIRLTRDDNVNTYRFIQEVAERIIEADEEKPPETLNSECRFCIRLATCDSVSKNVGAGGILGLSTEDMIDLRHLVDVQMSAQKALRDQLDEQLLKAAEESELIYMQTELTGMNVAVSKSRSIDAERAAQVIGPELASRYTAAEMKMGHFDELMKGDLLTAQQKAELRSLIFVKYGNPRVKTEKKSKI